VSREVNAARRHVRNPVGRVLGRVGHIGTRIRSELRNARLALFGGVQVQPPAPRVFSPEDVDAQLWEDYPELWDSEREYEEALQENLDDQKLQRLAAFASQHAGRQGEGWTREHRTFWTGVRDTAALHLSQRMLERWKNGEVGLLSYLKLAHPGLFDGRGIASRDANQVAQFARCEATNCEEAGDVELANAWWKVAKAFLPVKERSSLKSVNDVVASKGQGPLMMKAWSELLVKAGKRGLL